MKAYKQYFLTLSLLFIPLLATMGNDQQMTVEQCQQKIDGWHPRGSGIDQKVWSDAVTAFFSKANGGNFKCLLGVVDQKQPSTARMWIGTFKDSGPQQIFSDYAATGDSSQVGSDGKTHSNTPAVSQWIGSCNRAGSSLNRSGGKTCYMSTKGVNVCRPNSTIDSTINAYRQALGVPDFEMKTYINYGSRISGMILLHDGLQCSGQFRQNGKCKETWGCITIHPGAMRNLCEKYLGDNVRGQGQGQPGGMYLFAKTASSPGSPGCQSQAVRQALKKLERGEICGNVQAASIGSGSSVSSSMAGNSDPSSSNSSYNSDPSRSPADADARRSSAGSSGNIFQALIGMFSGYSQAETEQMAAEQQNQQRLKDFYGDDYQGSGGGGGH